MPVYDLEIYPPPDYGLAAPELGDVVRFMAAMEAGRDGNAAPDCEGWEDLLVGGGGYMWPNYAAEMATISLYWPATRFTLEVNDINHGIHVQEHYLNGERQVAPGALELVELQSYGIYRDFKTQVLYPEFDPGQLRPVAARATPPASGESDGTPPADDDIGCQQN